MSETAKHRSLFLPYCIGNGLDIGYGGDPIVETAITLDQADRYSFEGDKPQNITADACSLYMFADNSLDYVYSSHCIEDFRQTAGVLQEWVRVIKPGGFLCLLFPDERVYREKSKTPNIAHVYDDFGMGFVIDRLPADVDIVVSLELFENDDYNCALVLQKC